MQSFPSRVAEQASGQARGRCRHVPPFRPTMRSIRPRPCPEFRQWRRTALPQDMPQVEVFPKTDLQPERSGVFRARPHRILPMPSLHRECRRDRSLRRHTKPDCLCPRPFRKRSGHAGRFRAQKHLRADSANRLHRKPPRLRRSARRNSCRNARYLQRSPLGSLCFVFRVSCRRAVRIEANSLPRSAARPS